MNLNEYKKLCSTITNNIAREIRRRYPNLTVEIVQDDYYSRIKIGNLILNINYPTLDYDDIYRDGSATIYLTKEISTPMEKPQLDRGVVRMPTMNRVRTKKSNVNYNGNLNDSASLVNYLSKVKMFRDEISTIKEFVNKRILLRKRKTSEYNKALTKYRNARLEKLESRNRIKNEGAGFDAARRVSQLGGTLLSYMMDFNTYAEGELSDKLNNAYEALIDLVNAIDEQVNS